MEIESKFLVHTLPTDLAQYNYKKIEQGYISTTPVIRIRKLNGQPILTVKGKGLEIREEFEMPIEQEDYDKLLNKLEYPLIKKVRYYIPYNGYTIELDVFHEHLDGLILAEVEFKSVEEQQSFKPPTWFGNNVSKEAKYQNNRLCRLNSLDEL